MHAWCRSYLGNTVSPPSSTSFKSAEVQAAGVMVKQAGRDPGQAARPEQQRQRAPGEQPEGGAAGPQRHLSPPKHRQPMQFGQGREAVLTGQDGGVALAAVAGVDFIVKCVPVPLVLLVLAVCSQARGQHAASTAGGSVRVLASAGSLFCGLEGAAHRARGAAVAKGCPVLRGPVRAATAAPLTAQHLEGLAVADGQQRPAGDARLRSGAGAPMRCDVM